MDENNLKYLIYCRKSSESEDRQALSIEAQKRELLEFAKKEKIQIIDVLEESQSAFKPGRPVFDKMMTLCEEGSVNGVLCWKVDRLARNARDGGRVIQALDDKFLQEIRTPYELFRQEDNRMMLYIQFGMSNDFSRQISANVRRGNRQKYARGEFVGKAPLGYLNMKIGNSRNISPDPEKALFVKRLFEEFATGKYSVQDICQKADGWNLKSTSNQKIAKSGMYTLLRRTMYYGVYRHAGEYHQGSYEPLVTKELFDKVQEALRDRGKPKKQDWIHTYKGSIKCSNCGCSITATTKIKHYKGTNRDASYTYYHCTKRRGHCDQPWITEKELEEMIKGYMSKITIDREVWELGIELLKAKHSEEAERDIHITKQFEAEKDRLKRDLEKLLKMRLDEEITAQEYSESKKLLIDRKLELNEKTEDRESTSNNWLELAEGFFETAFQAREIMERGTLEQKRDLVRAVGWNLLLRGKKLEFSFRKPFDILLQPQARSDVQGCQDSNLEERFWRPP